jgi:hypothetical protein
MNRQKILETLQGIRAIKSKKDAEALGEQIKNGFELFYGFENFPYRGWTRIWFSRNNGYFEVYSKGYNWEDKKPSVYTEEEIQNLLWKERKYINHALRVIQREGVIL